MARTSEHKFTNRLIDEQSPYLLQHAHNPVDWYPWSEEAFRVAKDEDKPIFLSIGYSTCHWCHVMAHESFEDETIAEVINHYFVPVKVDREERPDIDAVYMSAVVQLTGQGGWPLTAILTADKKPFFAGTYFPPFAKYGSAGLVDILKTVAERWKDNREELISSSENITQALAAQTTQRFQTSPLADKSLLDAAYQQFSNHFDTDYGGFTQQPKFPSSHNLSFLMRYWHRTGESQALTMVTKTLDAMAQGGIYDHIGGGFHRYATDRYWQIPHFEKMLYDQALISRTYGEAYQITGNKQYLGIMTETFDYVLDQMTDEQGGFYSAEDADSPDETGQMREGAFYLWAEQDLKEHLTNEEFEEFKSLFAIRPEGNAHTDPHHEFVGKNIIYSDKPLTKMDNRVRAKLFKLREQRPKPHLDDKVLTDWNALMISALAIGGRITANERYLDAAKRAGNFLIKNMLKEDSLYHRYRKGDVAIEGHLDDYAFFINALIDLYETTGEGEYYEKSMVLMGRMIELFWDESNKGFFFSSYKNDELPFRTKDIYDGAMPSGNSMAAMALIRLAHMSMKEEYDQRLESMFHAFSASLKQYPMGYGHMLSVFDYILCSNIQIVLRSVQNQEFLQKAWEMIYNAYIPNKIVVPLVGQTDDSTKPETSYTNAMNNQADAVYICENQTCKMPSEDLESLNKTLTPLKRTLP